MFWKKNNKNADTAPTSKPISYSSVKIHPAVDNGVVAGAPASGVEHCIASAPAILSKSRSRVIPRITTCAAAPSAGSLRVRCSPWSPLCRATTFR